MEKGNNALYDLYLVSYVGDGKEEFFKVASFYKKEDAMSLEHFLNGNPKLGKFSFYEVHKKENGKYV